MYNAALGMSEHGMITAIFLTEMSLLVLALHDIVYLHTVVAFRGEQKAA
jgi:hypothetical protein